MKSFALIIIGLVLFQSQLSTCQEFFLDYGIDEGIHAIDEGPVFVDADIKNEIDVLVAMLELKLWIWMIWMILKTLKQER
jgi:hypothetical protein